MKLASQVDLLLTKFIYRAQLCVFTFNQCLFPQTKPFLQGMKWTVSKKSYTCMWNLYITPGYDRLSLALAGHCRGILSPNIPCPSFNPQCICMYNLWSVWIAQSLVEIILVFDHKNSVKILHFTHCVFCWFLHLVLNKLLSLQKYLSHYIKPNTTVLFFWVKKLGD